MTTTQITEAMTPVVKSMGCFLVEVSVSTDNDVVLTIESEEGIIGMEDCVETDRAFHALFNQDEEDYSLTVTSAGLDQPFKVFRQYEKAVGSEVEVKMKGGKKLVGTLLAADEESITLKYTSLESVEGKKKKARVEHEDRFPLSQVNSTRPYITFE